MLLSRMAKPVGEGNDEQPVAGPTEDDLAWAENFSKMILANLLVPEKWQNVRDAFFRYSLAQRRSDAITLRRKALVEAHFGRGRLEDLVAADPTLASFPLDPATSRLIELLREARAGYFRLRGKPEPALWSDDALEDLSFESVVERYSNDAEESAICAAIELIIQYADGGPSPIGESDPEIKAVTRTMKRVSAAISKGRQAFEKLRSKAETAGRIPIAVFRAIAVLDAADAGLTNSLLAVFQDEHDKELKRAILALDKVKPAIPRRLIADWVAEVGLAHLNEQTLNTSLSRWRKQGTAEVPRRKTHTSD